MLRVHPVNLTKLDCLKIKKSTGRTKQNQETQKAEKFCMGRAGLLH